MGSDSDLPTMQPAVEMLQSFGVATEVRVLSAHRTPLEMVAFAQQAAGRGFRVIIAGAGGAAHLPGMVASLTTLPVIGVPVAVGYGVSAGGAAALNGMLASCAPGLTVVNIDNGYGAAMAALRILSSQAAAEL